MAWGFLVPAALPLLLLCLTLCDVYRLAPTLLGKKDLVSLSILQHTSLHAWNKNIFTSFSTYGTMLKPYN